MKQIIFVTISLLLSVAFSGCRTSLREEVVSTFENGQPAVVHCYDRQGQLVLEKDYYENGALMMEGAMANDLRNGDWTSYFPDGIVQSTGTFKDGVRVGPSKVFHENGQLWMEGNYIDDHKCGEWVFYDEQGYEIERRSFGSCD